MARRRARSKMGLQELDKTQMELVAFPLIVRGNHWILLLLQPQDRRILVVDSLTKGKEAHETTIRSHPTKTFRWEGADTHELVELAATIMDSIPNDNSSNVWRVTRLTRYRQQDNFNCGIFT
eukprot:260632-Hanusia_phi.AAC.1